jgi:hypothetical protein
MPSTRSKPSKEGVRGLNKTAKRVPVAAKHAKKNVRKGAAATKATTERAVVANKLAAKKVVPKRSAAKKKMAKKAVSRKAVPKKPAAPAVRKAVRPAAAEKTSPVRAPVRRRDGSGHIEARYAKDLLERTGAREAVGEAFVHGSHTDDDLAEELGEEAVETMTSGEDEGEDVADQDVPEERGGPFVVTTAGTEFADGVDASNPLSAKREPFPTT